MASEVDIANGALVLIGAAEITSMDDASNNARAAKRHYARSRDAALAAVPWPFAIKRVKLAKLGTVPLWEFGAEYQIPPDSLRVLEVDIPEDKWKQEGSKILSDQDPVHIQYIWRVIDPTSFSAVFIEALEHLLAYKLAQSIKKDRALAKDMFALYTEKITDAATADTQTGFQDEATNDSLIDART